MACFSSDEAADEAADASTNNAPPQPQSFRRSSLRYSDGSLQYAAPTQFENRGLNPHRSRPDDHMRWPVSQALAEEPFFRNAYNIPTPRYSEPYEPSYFDPAESCDSYSQHVDLEKISEFEEWESSMKVKAEIQDLSIVDESHTSPPFSPFDANYPRCSNDSHPYPGLSRETSDESKASGRLDFSSPSETPQLKKRQSSSGKPVAPPSTEAEFGVKLEQANSCNSSTDKSLDSLDAEPALSEPEPKPKISAKASHSLIERKYRDNLNSKIVSLGLTLASTRQCKNETDSGDKAAPCKTRKADVLNEAMRYVKQAELESEAHIKEIDFLRVRVAALEKLVDCRNGLFPTQFAGTMLSQPGSC